MRVVTETGDAKVCDSSAGDAAKVSENGSASYAAPIGSVHVGNQFGGATVVDEFGLARLVSEHGDVKLVEIPFKNPGDGKWFLILASGLVVGMALLVPAGLLMLPAMGVAATGTVTTAATALAAAYPVACEIAAGVLVGAGTSAIMYPLMGGDDWEEFGTSMLLGAIEGGLSAGLAGVRKAELSAGVAGLSKAELLRKAQAAAVARCVTQMTDNVMHGRPVMENVLDSSINAALTSGLIACGEALTEVHIRGRVLASDAEIGRGFALRVLRDVAVGTMVSVIANITTNVIKGEKIFKNIGDALRAGAISGVIQGSLAATLHTMSRNYERTACIKDLERAHAQILEDGPGGLRELMLYCAAKDKNVALYDTEGKQIGQIGNNAEQEAIYLRFERGDDIGHYERLCPSTLEPLGDVIPTGNQTCLSDALGITPAELAACVTIENARIVYGNKTFVEVNKVSTELIGGMMKKNQMVHLQSQVSDLWHESPDGTLIFSTPAAEKFAVLDASLRKSLGADVAILSQKIADLVKLENDPLGWVRTTFSTDDTICHYGPFAKNGDNTLVIGKKTFREGFRLDTQTMANGVSLYQFQRNIKKEKSTFAAVTAPTSFGNKNPEVILKALYHSFLDQSVVYVADHATASIVEVGNSGAFKPKKK